MVHEVVTPSLSHVLTAFSECLRAYFPKLHLFFSNLLQKIFLDNPEIKLMFEGCCYGACHFNLHTASSKDYEDFLNVLFAMCAVYIAAAASRWAYHCLVTWCCRGISSRLTCIPPLCIFYSWQHPYRCPRSPILHRVLYVCWLGKVVPEWIHVRQGVQGAYVSKAASGMDGLQVEALGGRHGAPAV